MLNKNTNHQKYSYFNNYCAVEKNVNPLLKEPQKLWIYSADILLVFLHSKFFIEQVADYEINKPLLLALYIHTV
jgi:hypothetical protein